MVSINVDEQNSKYSSENGVLFDKNKLKIIRYPQKKEGNTYIMPGSVVSIEVGAFYHCTGLRNIEIPESVTNIGKRAFKDCYIESVILPEGITKIPSSAFEDCSLLSSATIPDTVTSIEGMAFSRCTKLKEIKMSNKVTLIGSNAFFGCDLTSIRIPNSVEKIEYDAFACNNNLTYAVIPNSVREIGNSIFRGSNSVFKIYLIKDSYAESYATKQSYSYEYLNLDEINVVEPPSNTIYNVGENFNSAGIIVSGVYKYNVNESIEYKIDSDDLTINPNGALEYGTSQVVISYEHNGITKNTNQPIEVKDNIAPTINSVIGNATEWTNQHITLTINATDEESGIASENAYSFDNGESWQTENTKTYIENTSGIIVKVKDNVGNIATYNKTINIDKIDKTAPTITISPNGASTSNYKNVTITVEDNGGSGLNSNNSYQYQLGTSNTEVPTGIWEYYTGGTEFTIGEELTGDYYLWIKRVSDNAGNNSSESEYMVSNKFAFDNTEKELEISSEKYIIDGDAFITNISPKTNVDNLLQNLTSNYEIKVYNKNNQELTGETLIGTGMRIVVNSQEYTLVVKGDVNGSGTVDLNDAINVLQHRAGGTNPQLTGAYLKAAQLTKSGQVTLNDVIKIMKYKATNGTEEL